MKLRRPRYLLPLAALVLLAAGLGLASVLSGDDRSRQLMTTEVQSRDIQQTVIASGTLQAFQQVSVGAQVSGQIKSLHVDFGDQVKKGDLIAEIDSLPQQNTLKNAKAALANIKAQRQAKQASLKQANLSFRRQQQMLAQNASSRSDYETAEAELDVLKAEIAALDAQIEQAQIQVDTATIDLGYTQITAPMDGTVVGVLVKEGQTVNSAQSAPTLVKLAQLDKMTIKAEISEADVVHVKPGQAIWFSILGEPGQRYEASLKHVEPAPDSINSDTDSSSSSSSSTDTAIYYNGVFDVPNPDGKLRIDMTAEVNIVLAQAEAAPSIPVAALGTQDQEGRYQVQVLLDNGRIENRRITTGLEDSLNVQILEGLSLHEKVIMGDASLGSSSAARRGPPMGF